MADTAPAKSTQFVDYSASPRAFVKGSDWGSKLRCSLAELTFTTAGFGNAIKLIRLPAGKVRVLVDPSRVVQSAAGAASSTLDIGNAAFTKADGTAGAADADVLATALAASAAIDSALDEGPKGYVEFDSQDGVDIEAIYNTANSPGSGTLSLLLVYMQGN